MGLLNGFSCFMQTRADTLQADKPSRAHRFTYCGNTKAALRPMRGFWTRSLER